MTRKKVNIFFLIVFSILLYSVSIGYSALSQNLRISGNSSYTHNVMANNVSYDPSSSGLTSTDLQAAIDEASLINFTILYKPESGISIAYNYSVASGTTWDQFRLNTSSHPDAVLYDGESGIEFKPSTSGTATEGVIRTSTVTTSLNDPNIVQPTHLIHPQVYYVKNGDYCCFDPDTLIVIDFEGHTKKIKDFEVGDSILVENVKTKEKLITTVVKDASEHPITYDMTELTLENGTKLKFNSYHPIYTTEGYKSVTNYNDYETLEEGDFVVDFNGETIKIVKIYNYVEKIPIMTYNLLIKGINEDFLEEEYAYLANGILVHTGIAKYDDEDEWRTKHRNRCKYQKLYKDFDYDKATDEEIIDFLVELYFKNKDAEKEYIKYYINAEQYFRYTEFAIKFKKEVKQIEESNSLPLNRYSINSDKIF